MTIKQTLSPELPPFLLDADTNVVPFPEPKLDANTQAILGDRLRAMYAELLCEPVPERLLRVLHAFEDKAQEEQRS